MKRMDRYKENTINRSEKNAKLYENIGNNVRVAEVSDVENSIAIDIEEAKSKKNTREGYHKLKEYIEEPKVTREIEEFNTLYNLKENKVYDINIVLEEANKNKPGNSQVKKLENEEFNILAGLSNKELNKYLKESKKKVIKPTDEEDCDDLLNDLLATDDEEKVSSTQEEEKIEYEDPEKSLSKVDIEKVKKLSEEITQTAETGIMKNADKDFFTRSMDINKEDFDSIEEAKEEERKTPLLFKIFIFLVILVIIIGVVYFIYLKYLNK
mgnify:FL=1